MNDKEKAVATEYRGHALRYFPRDDFWMGGPAGMPGRMGTLPQVMEAIDRWEVEKNKLEGISVWLISHDNPKYWEQRDAVFRSGMLKAQPGYYRDPTHTVWMQNSRHSPDSLFSVARGYVAMNTPEALEAIETAKVAFAEAVEAKRRWLDAKKRIPTMTEEEWLKLREKPE